MIAVIDYGMGNLRSVGKALELVGAKVCVTADRRKIGKAKGIVLPGVGAFNHAMENLRHLNLISVISDTIRGNKPFLGICLGMQLLFPESEEGGRCKGLDIVEGKVRRFKVSLKVPHMGWNQINIKNEKSKILEGIPDNSYMYFVHSYYVIPEQKEMIATTTFYGREFTSAIIKDNIFGVQFHPEKSDRLGLKILENFCKLC
jgi:glutamine amidotransferase